MLKVKDSLLKKIYKDKYLTNTEIMFLIYLLQRCDEKGFVKGIYYKDVSNDIGCSVAQYYNIISNLCKLGYIKKEKDRIYKSDMDILVYGNDFSNAAGFRDYVDINISLLMDSKFMKLRAGAKRVFLYLLFRIKKQGYKAEIKNKKNVLPPYRDYKSIAKHLGITERMIISYCKELEDEKIISIGKKILINKKTLDVITVSVKTLETPKISVTEKGALRDINTYSSHLHDLHFVQTACRHFKITSDALNLRDAALLLHQYEKTAKERGKNIYKIFMNAIKELETSILDSKLIHFIMKTLVNKDYALDMLIFT